MRASRVRRLVSSPTRRVGALHEPRLTLALALAACRACLRTARFEGRDEASVVCCYDKRPAPSKKGGKRGAASKAQQTVAAVSQGAVDAGPSHQAGSSSQSTPCA